MNEYQMPGVAPAQTGGCPRGCEGGWGSAGPCSVRRRAVMGAGLAEREVLCVLLGRKQCFLPKSHCLVVPSGYQPNYRR